MRLVISLAVLALAGCSPPSPSYAPGVEMTFMPACEARSEVPGLCACIWDKIEAEITPAEFTALERLPGPERESHPLTAQINQYAYACATQLNTMEPAPAP